MEWHNGILCSKACATRAGVEAVRQFHYGRRMAHASTPSQRMLRAGELIRHALVSVIQRGETSDPELDKLAPTITEVQLSPDLKIEASSAS